MGRAREGEAHQVGLWAQALDRSGQEEAASQCPCDRTCQQAGAYRLERSRAWPSLRSERAASRLINYLRANRVNSHYPPRSARGGDEMEVRSSRGMRPL